MTDCIIRIPKDSILQDDGRTILVNLGDAQTLLKGVTVAAGGDKAVVIKR